MLLAMIPAKGKPPNITAGKSMPSHNSHSLGTRPQQSDDWTTTCARSIKAVVQKGADDGYVRYDDGRS